MEFFVSLSGNDNWSGRLAEPNAAGSDGPFRTVRRAQRAVQSANRRKVKEDIRVVLRGGVHFLDTPLRFTASTSVTSEKSESHALIEPERSLTYAAYPGERPALSGGRQIAGWKIQSVRGRTVWVADLPEVRKGTWHFRQLWVNGRRRFRPRLPECGEYRVAEALDANYKGSFAETIFRGSRRFVYAEGDLKPWRNLTDVEICVTTLWMDLRMRIQSLDTKRRIVRLDRNSGRRMTDDSGQGGAFYFVENVWEMLRKPGQWYLDRPRGKLYYIPLPGEKPETAKVIAPALSELVRIEGQPDKPVESIFFQGIELAHSEWKVPADMAGSIQASADVPGAVVLRHARNCRFERCGIAHVGSYGIELAEDCQDIIIRGNAIRDLGAGGVKIWHGCRRNTVADNEIGDGGHLFLSAAGALIGKATGTQLLHNHIHDFYYTGVSVGWTWGYADSNCYGNVVEWNHIHDIGKGKLSDMGGIYTLGVQPGTRLRYNLIHDVESRTLDGARGIYLDEGSSDMLIENNICFRTKSNLFHHHYGRHNLVRNNIFAMGRWKQSQIGRSRVEGHVSFRFERNIVCYDGGYLLTDGVAPDNAVFRNNLYWRGRGPVRFGAGSRWLASRTFPRGFRGEAQRFDTLVVQPSAPPSRWRRPPESRFLGAVPRIAAPSIGIPSDADWRGALRLPDIVTLDGQPTKGGSAEARALSDGRSLYVRVVCRDMAGRTQGTDTAEGRWLHEHPEWFAKPDLWVWAYEHVEILVKPDMARVDGLQFGLSRDGKRATRTLAGDPASAFTWAGVAHKTSRPSGWFAVARLPIAAIASACGGGAREWGIMIGLYEFLPDMEFRQWQARGMDAGSIVANPRFVDANKGNFRFRKGSPCSKIGFVPFDLSCVGPRPESRRA